MNIPERKIVPPEPEEPVTQCWMCNEDIYADDDVYIDSKFHVIKADHDECIHEWAVSRMEKAKGGEKPLEIPY